MPKTYWIFQLNTNKPTQSQLDKQKIITLQTDMKMRLFGPICGCFKQLMKETFYQALEDYSTNTNSITLNMKALGITK